ncbi:MAG: amidohydrolase [Defluviitaleaceae bacterium]|nr:amidohydrolase [Defluviitaleaceae bacterium]
MLEQLTELHPQMIEIRRHFHMNPELSFKEEKTPAHIAEYLEKLGNVEVRRNVGGRGVVGIIKGKNPGKTVALRADFDALELQDEKDVPYKSQVPGVMHACAHDGHAAALMGVANVLSKNTDSFDGEVRLIFQHAEESAPGGAIAMIEDGCLDGVDAIFGTHITSRMPVGIYGYRSGYLMASADKFIINIQGKGGHGAAPHETVDAIVVAANLILNLQTIVSRRVNPMAQAVISVGKVEAGGAFNVIADTAKVMGTVRTFDTAVQDVIIENMEMVVKGCCDAAGATYTLSYEKGYPAVKNHKAETEMAAESLAKIAGKQSLVELEPLMGGEDFSYYLEKVPGSFLYAGGGNAEKGINHPHHHPKFDIDEDSLLFSSKGMLAIALDFLRA